jgi:uncharacterized membrane protein (Fun14 family)
MNAAPSPIPGTPPPVTPPVDPSYAPYILKGGVGLIVGFVVGFLLRQALFVGLIFLGMLVIIFQAAAHYGVITINWNVLQGLTDPNVAGTHVTSIWNRLYDTATYNLPYAGGFVPGFFLGLRRWRR